MRIFNNNNRHRMQPIAGLVTAASLLACITMPVIACEFEIASSSLNTSQINYDVFSATPTSATSLLEIRRVDSQSAIDSSQSATDLCVARIQIRSADSQLQLSNNDYSLNYELHSPTLASSDQLIDITSTPVAVGGRYQLPFSVELPAGQFVPSGLYQSTLTASVGADNPALTKLTDIDEQVSFNLRAQVAESARISFAGVQGRNQLVDFGPIVNGARPLFTPSIVVQSTAPYRLRFRSDNNGRLVRNPPIENQTISYNLEIAGQSVDLSNPEAGVLFDEPFVARDNRVPLLFSIPDASNKVAGTYSDRVIVDILPSLQ